MKNIFFIKSFYEMIRKSLNLSLYRENVTFDIPSTKYKGIKDFVKRIYRNYYVIFAPFLYILSNKESKKYLLCRPRGGLNDCLVRIEYCLRYALKYKRKLYIDMSRSAFSDDLENYFYLPIYINTKEINFIEYPASVYPEELKNDIYNYEAIYTPQPRGHVTKNGTSLKFDFQKKYHEQYLIYESGGGGIDSIYFLKRIKLRKELVKNIKSKIEGLGVYSAIHIRNTDMKSDYKLFIDTIKDELCKEENNIVLCTDSYEVQQYCKSMLGIRIIIASIPDMNGKAIHTLKLNHGDKYNMNTDAIIDLFVLACSKKLYICKTTIGYYSGFSLLAMNLNLRKNLIKKMLK